MIHKLLDVISECRKSKNKLVTSINAGSAVFEQMKTSCSHMMYYSESGVYFEGIAVKEIGAPDHLSVNILETIGN